MCVTPVANFRGSCPSRGNTCTILLRPLGIKQTLFPALSPSFPASQPDLCACGIKCYNWTYREGSAFPCVHHLCRSQLHGGKLAAHWSELRFLPGADARTLSRSEAVMKCSASRWEPISRITSLRTSLAIFYQHCVWEQTQDFVRMGFKDWFAHLMSHWN